MAPGVMGNLVAGLECSFEIGRSGFIIDAAVYDASDKKGGLYSFFLENCKEGIEVLAGPIVEG